ncbi:MAG: C40 family peptidase [Cytophagales bacterium]
MTELNISEQWLCTYPTLALRKEPNHRSEMTTQLLYGDVFSILEIIDDWCLIEIEYDQYIGWLDKKLFYGELIKINDSIRFSYVNSQPIFYEGKLIPAGSFVKEKSDEFIKHFSRTDIYDVVLVAKSYLDSPYLWGGKTHWGIDCSGFVQQVFKICGVKIPRDAYQQADLGINIKFGEHKNGDLAFFGEKEKITHVGLLVDEHDIIHAHGLVRIDGLTEKGIINKKIKQKTHSLMHIKRIL